MSDLYERLRRIRENKKSPIPDRAVPERAVQDHGVQDQCPGADWERVVPAVYRRNRELPVPGDPGVSCGEGCTWQNLSAALFGKSAITPLFVDVETSGLSAGAGSVAFLVGLGRFSFGRDRTTVQVEQFFLSDLGGERSFTDVLHNAIAADCGEDPVYVTYNGASFDLPVLRTRAIMVRSRFRELPHLDLLPVTRRLFSPVLDSCRLSAVEENVLMLERSNDIPGSEVPERYLSFLRTGDAASLSPVLDHHFYDIAHLAFLALYLNQVLVRAASLESPTSSSWASSSSRATSSSPASDSRAPLPLRGVAPDDAGLFRLLIERGDSRDRERGEETLREKTLIWQETDRWARLARAYIPVARRQRRWEELIWVLQKLARYSGALRDAVDLAIQLEHRLRDYGAALSVVRASAARHGWDNALRHREARLLRRINLGRSRTGLTGTDSRTTQQTGPTRNLAPFH